MSGYCSISVPVLSAGQAVKALPAGGVHVHAPGPLLLSAGINTFSTILLVTSMCSDLSVQHSCRCWSL